MSVVHLLTSLTLSVSHSNSNTCLHYYHAPLWDKALQALFSLNILSRSKRRMLHLLGSLIGWRVKVQRVDETDRNPITPGVTQFHWNSIDHNQHDSWWSLASKATKKAWLFSTIFLYPPPHKLSVWHLGWPDKIVNRSEQAFHSLRSRDYK